MCQIIMVSTLKLYNDACQLYLKKAVYLKKYVNNGRNLSLVAVNATWYSLLNYIHQLCKDL